MKFILALILSVSILSCSSKFTEKSIVKVLNADGTGGGTGFVTDSEGSKVIGNNDHVCQVAFGGYVRIEQDDGTPGLKQILRRSFNRDLCVVEGIDAPSLKLSKDAPKRFDRVKVLGHPGLRPTAPSEGVYTGMGIVPIGFSSRPDGTCPDGSESVQSFFGSFCVLQMELGYTTAIVVGGNSGSPITNSNGEVIGVINSSDNEGHHGMFVPLNYLKDILNE
jgi:hypothetical protein